MSCVVRLPRTVTSGLGLWPELSGVASAPRAVGQRRHGLGGGRCPRRGPLPGSPLRQAAAARRRHGADSRLRGTSMSVPTTTLWPVTALNDLEWRSDANVTGTPLTLTELAGKTLLRRIQERPLAPDRCERRVRRSRGLFEGQRGMGFLRGASRCRAAHRSILARGALRSDRGARHARSAERSVVTRSIRGSAKPSTA